jgi:hypothetical protein
MYAPENVEAGVDSLLARLKTAGVDLIRLDCGIPEFQDRNNTGYQFFFVADEIDAWADHIDMYGPELEAALSIEGVPFFLSQDEIADFRHELSGKTDPADWLELSPDGKDGLQSDEGTFGFRKSRIALLYAAPERPYLVVETADGWRTLVPMRDAASKIHDLAARLPQLHMVADTDDRPRLYADPVRMPDQAPHMPSLSPKH